MSDNLIANGGFDNNSSQWNFTSSGSGVTTEEEIITVTNKYCRITSTEAIYQQIPTLDVDKKYTVKIDSKSAFLKGTLSIMTSNTNDVFWSTQINESKNSLWHTEEYSFAPESSWVAPFMLHIRAEDNPDKDLYLDVDNIVVSELV